MAKAKAQSGRPRAARRSDPEQMSRLLIVGGVAAVLLIAAGVIAFGWYQTEIKPGGKTVLTVGELEYSLNAVTRRARLTQQENTFLQNPQYAGVLPETVLLQLTKESKLILRADTISDTIKVSDEDIDNKIKQNGGLAADADARAFAAEYSKQVKASGLHRDEFRQKIKADLLEEKVRNYYLYLSPKEEPQVRARLILVEDAGAAKQAKDRLDAGEDFATVAREVSRDSASAEKGGEIDWTPRGTLPKDVESFLFQDATIGQRSDIYNTDVGSYIVELVEREESRELDATQKQIVASRALQDWYDAQDEELTVENKLSQDDINRIVDDVY